MLNMVWCFLIGCANLPPLSRPLVRLAPTLLVFCLVAELAGAAGDTRMPIELPSDVQGALKRIETWEALSVEMEQFD